MRLILAIFFLACLSCSKPSPTDDLIGLWKIHDYDGMSSTNPIYTFNRVDTLGDFGAVVFEEENVFKSWDHGWCGTPPHTYFFTNGKYDQVDDEMIELDINHYYLEGVTYRILRIESDTLEMEFIK